MARTILRFNAVALWARREAIRLIEEKTKAEASEKLISGPTSGVLRIEGDREEVDKAVDLIVKDNLLGKLFTK